MDYANSSLNIKSLDDAGRIEGLLSGFDNQDRHGDIVRRGAFTKTLAERSTPLPMLLHHDRHRPIGAWKEWSETSAGLYVKGSLALAVADAQEAYALAKAGALTGLSIGYLPKEAKQNRQTGGQDLLAIDLIEGSLVAVPSNPLTHVSVVKSIVGPRDIAEILQDAGLSSRKAKAAAGAAWKAINQSDDDEQADAALAAILTAATARLAS
ncbi:MAG: HK97 family phage prohead protease [Sphingopyxis sp.]|uniref:HK97 family phage prohead protease n=1 Tax=Sphingopyxis sp. TaxID=1908224 RepID=UPI001A56ABDF|nr:HK97 family phage prohead protease [Sphingopyxis sp.]MBL9066458.1 HK97 family phage prohead protease [Sphingopyxis sp.]